MENLERKISKLQKEKEELLKEKELNKEKMKEYDKQIEELEEKYKHQLILMCLNNREIDQCYDKLVNRENMSFKNLFQIEYKLLNLNHKSKQIVSESIQIQDEISGINVEKRILQDINTEIEYRLYDIDEELKNVEKPKVYKRRRV